MQIMSFLTFLVASGLGGMCGGFSSSHWSLACSGGGSGAVRIWRGQVIGETRRSNINTGIDRGTSIANLVMLCTLCVCTCVCACVRVCVCVHQLRTGFSG